MSLHLSRNCSACESFFRNEPGKDRIEYFNGSVADYETVLRACRGCDGVFHLASFGMSGREMLQHELIRKVNVVGTENVVRACKELRIQRLVYTSTTNVVFRGQELLNKDESEPYARVEDHIVSSSVRLRC